LDKIAFQKEFFQYLPKIRNNCDYESYRRVLERIDQLLNQSGLEAVEEEVKHLIDSLGKNGRHILAGSHNLQGNIPFANLAIMVKTVKGG